MNDQFGFDFGNDASERFSAQEPGTWLDPEFTTAQYTAIFAKAREVVQGIAGPARSLFWRGLEAALAEQAEMLKRCELDDEPYHLCRTRCDPSDDEFDAFVEHCQQMIGAALPGIAYKVRKVPRDGLTAAMYVRDLGTLIAWRWSADNRSIDFRPWRDSFFVDSYRDGMPAIKAPYSTWGGAYCADKLAYSNDGVASVPTFVLNGREYINDGGFGSGNYRECEGWTFCALVDWQGPTYNYRSQCHAWDDGSLERGDRRGLIVRVRGQLCVLDGAATIYDNEASEAVFVSDTDDQVEDDAECVEEVVA
jgi:hypothetical protein